MNQPHGGLFPHALHAGNIVGAVPHQGLEVNHVNGGKAILLPEGRFRHVLGGSLSLAGGNQFHLRVLPNELKTVLVPGHHHALPARRGALPGNRAQEVIRLPALQLITGDVQCVQYLLQHRNLHTELLRHGLPGGLVGRVRLVAEGGCVEVEGNAHRVRGLLPLQAQQRRQKTKDGVGVEPVPGRQGPDAVVGPVDDAVSVDDHELHRESPPVSGKIPIT